MERYFNIDNLEQQYDSYNIPTYFFDKNSKYSKLSTNSKIIYSIINSDPDINFRTIKEMLNLDDKTIRKSLKELNLLGLYEERKINHEEIVLKLKNKELNIYICEWCNEKVPILHEHHYPIPKSKGGTETVKICPNCHCGFHYIAGVNWSRE